MAKHDHTKQTQFTGGDEIYFQRDTLFRQQYSHPACNPKYSAVSAIATAGAGEVVSCRSWLTRPGDNAGRSTWHQAAYYTPGRYQTVISA